MVNQDYADLHFHVTVLLLGQYESSHCFKPCKIYVIFPFLFPCECETAFIGNMFIVSIILILFHISVLTGSNQTYDILWGIADIQSQ